MPLISIVMPTRNRAHLLKYALQSAVEQTFDDLEIIVSDNFSTDNTAEVVQQHNDARLRYVRTSEALSISDSWEFALSHARGEYVTYLCDDDAINSHLMERVASIILKEECDVICWPQHPYYGGSWYETDIQNTLFLFAYPHRVTKLDSRACLGRLFSTLSLAVNFPLMLNAAYSRRVIELAKAKIGRFFLSPCPDYASSAAILGVTKHYIFFDDGLALGGMYREGIGASTSYRGATGARLDYIEEFKGEALFTHVPLAASTGVNDVAETLLRVKYAMPKEFEDVDIDWLNYFVSNYIKLLKWQKNGADISKDVRNLFDTLSQRAISFRLRFWLRVIRTKLATKLLKIDTLRRTASKVIPNQRVVGITKIRGEDAGFSNILECARMVDNIQARYIPHPR